MKLKFIKESQIKLVMNIWIQVLTKMLWKFVKIQKIAVLFKRFIYVTSKPKDSGQLGQ